MDKPLAIAERLERDGYAGPLPVFSADECAQLVKVLLRDRRKGRVWPKEAAVRSRAFYEAATNPLIVAAVREALGEDIILWGATLVIKRDTDVHPFHTDIESADPAGGFATVWIGLQNTALGAGLKFVPGSHRYGVSIQEDNQRRGVERDRSTDETTLNAAREHEPGATIVEPDVTDGEALLFDGRLWHGSHNRTQATRTALLLQYARADKPVFMPKGFTWPFQYETERPPVQLISGRAPMGVNRMAGPPLGAVPNAAWPLPPEAQTGAETFASIRHFEGETPKLDYIECHTSVLAPGASPHPLHNHDEEEILLVVRGEAEIQTANDGKGTNLTRTTLRPGDFGYYPALQFHTIVNASTAPVMYTMFKWRNDGGRSGRHDSLTFGRTSTGIASDGSPKHLTRLVEFGTRWLDRLQGHLSIASPPASYAAHADPYDVAIVLIEGAIETLGQPLEAPAVLYHPAGAMHGLAAVGDAPARYLVFEFDAQRIRTPLTSLMRLGPRGVSLARRAVKKLRREIGKRLR